MSEDTWLTVTAEAAHYVDHGRETILCDRLPRPITLVLKNPVFRDGGFLPLDHREWLPSSLADRVGASAFNSERAA